MKRTEFEHLVARARAEHPHWFELERELPATPETIAAVERRLGVRLPEAFRDVLSTYGAGVFAFAVLLGVSPDSPWELARHAAPFRGSFVPAIDNECGDYYGFLVRDGRCDGTVVFWDHETESIRETEFEDAYALLASVAFRPR